MQNSPTARLATADDLPAIRQLAAELGSAIDCQLLTSDSPTHDLFTSDGGGFLVLRRHLVRGITGDRESVIEDRFAPDRALFERAIMAARGYASQYLTVEVRPEEDRRLLTEFGFRLESHKISVATAECAMPADSPYCVRLAEPDDHFLIAIRNAEMLSHTVCGERDYDLGDLTLKSMDDIFRHLGSQDPNSLALVLTKGQEQVAHLLLELTQSFGYIYDLAVAREHWGGKAVLHIMRAGRRLLFERNLPRMVGDVSQANPRALKYARRFLGFSVDSERYGLKL